MDKFETVIRGTNPISITIILMLSNKLTKKSETTNKYLNDIYQARNQQKYENDQEKKYFTHSVLPFFLLSITLLCL